MPREARTDEQRDRGLTADGGRIGTSDVNRRIWQLASPPLTTRDCSWSTRLT
jgi:hypothetical protein